MFKNYFKTAVRTLWKKKSFSFLNIAGLAVGITCAALIFLWVEDELTYNDYFKKKDQLYQVMGNQAYDGKIFTFSSTPGLLAPAIQEEVPGIKVAARVTWGDRFLLSQGETKLYGDGLFVDSAFLDLFSLDFTQGNRSSAFSQLHSIVLTERMALKLFNTTSVVGKTVRVDNKEEYLIGGVYKNLPANTRFEAIDWLIPFEVYRKRNDWLQYWGNNGVQTFVEVDPKSDLVAMGKQLKGFIKGKQKEAIAEPLLLAARDWRLRSEFEQGKQSGGRIRYVKLFTLVGWIILILACINFMNLATARSEQRAREVGVRKVMGSGKGMLIGQFLTESVIMAMVAMLLAVVLAALVLPLFNQLVEKQMLLNLFQPSHFLSLLAIGLLCGLIAGSYPAFYLSSFNPITVLKGLKMPGRTSAAAIRKGLVITQFVISVSLIVCTVIIYQQIMHTRNRELGLNKNNLISLDQQLISVQQDGNMGTRFAAIRNDLLNTGVVEDATLSNGRIFRGGTNSSNFSWKGKDPNRQILISMDWVTPSFVKTLGLKILAGRDFYPGGKGDSLGVIINEAMARLLKENPADAVGEAIQRDNTNFSVIAVVQDYVYSNVYGATAPMVVFSDVDAQNTSQMAIRFKSGNDYKASLDKAGQVLKGYNPDYPFEYKFIDAEFEKLFKGESLIGTLAALFAGLAIFISCLGLFGLAAYMAEKRIREIGIRKVLGASIPNLTGLLSRDFLMLVSLSCLIAFPISWWIMHNWLQSYEYRVSLQWWMFAIPGLGALLIALITVSFQAIKAALINPIKCLRSE